MLVERMTAVAEKILEEFQSLAPAEQVVVAERIVSLAEERAHGALKRLRGASKGEGLLEKLLADRARERARG